MNLVTRFLAARRDKLLMKLGCWLVCFSLVLGLMLPQQRAEALVAELSMTAVTSLVAAYFGACGMSFIFVSPDPDKDPKNDLVKNIQRLIQEFLDTDLGGISIQTWLGDVWELFLLNRKLVVGRHLLDKLMEFAQWVAGRYATQAGENIVYEGKEGYPHLSRIGSYAVWDYPYSVRFTKDDSVSFVYFVVYYINEPGNYVVFIPKSESVEKGNYFYVESINLVLSDSFLSPSSTIEASDGYFYYYSVTESDLLSGPIEARFYIRWANDRTSVSAGQSFPISLDYSYFAYADIVSESLSIDRAPSMSYIPEGIAAEQGIALDVGAAATMDLDQVLQGVLDDVLAKTLTSTMTAADEATENPPATDEITDVDNLGLPALGAALTSRFPFSIPWDFFRAVQLLAAPAKAPYFEVDFMEPLADDVGGWQGDTTVILDFSEYAIIGQISRWTSTIGFCLMLAGATKRLIWTA